jgi:hypothetical protein
VEEVVRASHRAPGGDGSSGSVAALERDVRRRNHVPKFLMRCIGWETGRVREGEAWIYIACLEP